jgi:hypothetical protein
VTRRAARGRDAAQRPPMSPSAAVVASGVEPLFELNVGCGSWADLVSLILLLPLINFKLPMSASAEAARVGVHLALFASAPVAVPAERTTGRQSGVEWGGRKGKSIGVR